MNHIFIGYDERQPASFTALSTSILRHAKKPVAITPLILGTLPLQRAGLTPFTWSRFLVPWLMNYQGWALFLDVDMMLRNDISELFELADYGKAVMVSKNKIQFEWASAMLFNCAHLANRILTPDYIANAKALHGLQWLKDEHIGELPGAWNHLVGYDPPNPDAKLVHFTQGVPGYEETQDSEFAEDWKDNIKHAISTLPWETLMGPSVHAVEINGRLMPRYKLEKRHESVQSIPG